MSTGRAPFNKVKSSPPRPARAMVTGKPDRVGPTSAGGGVVRAARTELHWFVQQAPTAIAMFDRKMNYLAVSERWLHDYGRGRRDIIGLNHYTLYPDLPRRWKAIHRRGLAGQAQSCDEEQWVWADGRRVWLSWEVRPWMDVRGKVGGILIVAEDISARKAAEEVVRDSEERLRFAMETSHIGMWDLNLTDHAAVRSREHARIFGYTGLGPEWTYERFLEHVLPEERARVHARIQQAITGKRDLNLECRIRRHDGKVRWIWAAGRHRLDAAGKRGRMVGIVQDITSRAEAREALYTASQLNQQIISGAKEGIIVYGRDLKYLVWNPFMEELTGVPAAQVLGKHPLEVFPFLEAAGLMEQLHRVLAGKESTPVDFPFRVASTNHSGWVSDTNSALRNAAGEITGVIGLVRDITQRKKTDERIAQLSRVQAILTGIDRAIVHIRDRQKLLDEICRLAVQQGGFQLAWIGMVAPEGIVRPVAQAGATGYLKGIQVVVRNSPEGRGPVGTAIRENRPVVIDSIRQSQSMSPWLERACKFGLNYVAAFPLRIRGKAVGAFQVYAPRAEFFDENEVGLLTQVSDDISFALTAISDLEARQEAQAELRRSEQNLSNFFNQAPIGLVWLSAAGVILRANQAQLDLLGYGAEEYVGHHFTEFSAAPSQGRELLKRLAAGETVRNMPMTRRRKDGKLRHVLVDANSFWSDGRFHYSSIFLRNITDRVELERELMQVGEREYRRIAQDLHDGLGQLLAGTAYLAGSLRQELSAKGLPQARQSERIQEVINEAIRWTRSLARGLHPVEPVPNGLMAALRVLAARTSALFQIPCQFKCRRPVLLEDNAVATHLFRIAQEAVTNALKHSNARHIVLGLTGRPGLVQLVVGDDGVGLPRPPRRQSGAGFHILRHRAAMIGGSLAVQTEPGGGTVIRCTVHTSAEGSCSRAKPEQARS